MRTLGLIGGMSWESTTTYYRLLNEMVRERLGHLHSAELILWSVDFERIARLQHTGQWDAAAEALITIAGQLEEAGAEALMICTNTMHKLADIIEASLSIPLIHIADATGEAIKAAQLKRPALLGTRFTMEQDFYKERLTEKYGIEAIIPDEAGRQIIHEIIYDELCKGLIKDTSKAAYLKQIELLRKQGADSVILGCTEIGLLISQKDTDLPVFDTTSLHAEAAVNFALS
ncbi:aspartate/glutamate racemase family protein [Microvirga sp. W0021]|uniref:Aspartate/glutamate racemase family protein n=1 Tax=Hohaiivirga grylli TaxID=3133970 RepID=A0ABV0BHF3_9HYPH